MLASSGPTVGSCLFVSLLGLASALKVETICSSELSVNFYQISRHQIPEDSTYIILNLHELCHAETQLSK
jgi:hypothetical protein